MKISSNRSQLRVLSSELLVIFRQQNGVKNGRQDGGSVKNVAACAHVECSSVAVVNGIECDVG